MDRIPKIPPRITPLPEDDITRPMWSVMIPAYNCSLYLRETILSVLDQDLGENNMQIEVIDDASTDADVRKIVEEVGKGRVKYFRHPYNVGSLRNFETCINRSRGHIIHILHGDDRIKNGYYKKIGELFSRWPDAGAAFCNHSLINHDGTLLGTSQTLSESDGILENWLYKIAKIQLLQYAAISVKRKVYEDVGSFFAVTYGEDWEMWARIATKYTTLYSPADLAEYRLHFDSISGGSYKKAKNLTDLSAVIKIINGYLKDSDRKKMLKEARKTTAYDSLDFAKNIIWPSTKSRRIVLWQIYGVLKLYIDRHILKQSAQLFFYTLK